MTTLSSDTLIAAADRLITEIGTHAGNQDTLELQGLEQCARTLCTQLKAIQDLDAHNLRQQQAETGQKYTPYEDLPPLTLEERDRLKQKFITLLAPPRIEEPRDEPRTISKASKRQH